MNKFQVLVLMFGVLTSCAKHSVEPLPIPAFPYQAILDSCDDNVFPEIGNDGEGFDPITNNIEYCHIPDSLQGNTLVDSLSLYYNIVLAYNTVAYDISTTSRYCEDSDFDAELYASAIQTANLEGISDSEIRNTLGEICSQVAASIRKGLDPGEESYPSVGKFYERFDTFEARLMGARIDSVEYDPSVIIPYYDEIHLKAISDTINYRDELMQMTLREEDFQKKCIYARELANSYFVVRADPLEIVSVIDPLLKDGRYSPLLFELWLIWRAHLQQHIFGGPSNDSAMYNLFYNSMRNRVAGTCMSYLSTNPTDKLAFKVFVRLARRYCIVRNSGCYIGNNSYLDELDLYNECLKNSK